MLRAKSSPSIRIAVSLLAGLLPAFFHWLTPEQRQSIKTEYENSQRAELPERESPNLERRSKLVAEQAANAPERLTEERTRSVSVGLEEVKEKAEHYLRGQYTNSGGEMICQVCKSVLPFQLDNGLYYFEKTEFLPSLRNRHYQNYLALCPDHAAMFHYANRSKDLMLDMFMKLEGNELDVVLAKLDETIYFTKKHIDDLKTIITVDQKE